MLAFVIGTNQVFSGFAFAVPTKDQTAETAAKVLVKEVFQSFGCLERMLLDQGLAFESQILKELCVTYGCTKMRTTPYCAQGHGVCERWN